MPTGVVLDFGGGVVGIAELGDEPVVASWPANARLRWNVSVNPEG